MRILSAPRELDERVLRFCKSISPERPLYVRSKPVSKAKGSHCFDNVTRQIKRKNGSVAYGWAIWHWPGRYFEAEHHGVWRSPGGMLIDVSPQLDGRNRILFLPDPTAIYDPEAFRSNILEAEDSDPVSNAFVSAGRDCLRILEKYRRTGIAQPIVSSGDNLRLLQLRSQIEALSLQMDE